MPEPGFEDGISDFEEGQRQRLQSNSGTLEFM